MASRAQPTVLNEWWRTVDRLTLAALGALMLGGIVLCLAASPPVATRIGLDPFHFVNRQVLFLIPAAGVLIATSFLSPREIRQVSIIVFAVSIALAFFTVPHVAQRINRFIDPASGDTFNIDIATESFIRGGWFGRGPGEGTIKRILPEGHTDFVFAVAAEEFGVVLCLILVALFAFIVLRALTKAMRAEDPFIRFAAAGLAILFGMQSTINMAVNLHLIPAKGMTLPFISYGGSSLIFLPYRLGLPFTLTPSPP